MCRLDTLSAMSRAGTLILLGSVIATAPFLGIPFYVLSWAYLVLGIMVVLTGISIRVRKVREETVVEPSPAPSFDIHEPQRPQP